MAAGITKRELAKRLNVHETVVCRIEGNKNSPRIPTLKRIAKALDVELVITFKPRTTIE
jgi:transcriptional regulator with XRE-family HTH domain